MKPKTIPTDMWGGRVVPPFDISITHCGYCGRKLEWQTKRIGAYSKERWDYEKAIIKAEPNPLHWPIVMFGQPGIEWHYGCPRYGKKSFWGLKSAIIDDRFEALATDEPWEVLSGRGDVGWHYHWSGGKEYDEDDN